MIYKKYIKSFLDIIFAFIVLLVLLIPFIIIAILIKIDSKGPVFFRQERLGKDKKTFLIYKFRTMTNVKRETNQVYKDNSEITRLGRYLRRFKIDEMPQILNVLFGDMAVIGPRPCLPNVTEKFGLSDQYRFMVKPGLSSIAGVNGSIYLSWEEKWWYDKNYVENLSLALDLKIFLKTFLVIIMGEEKFLNKPKMNEHGN
jgi:lipopolysaccharide/colanic/teichoic acid biosynthesis glycosyltransferase